MGMGPVLKPGVTSWSECSSLDLINFLNMLDTNPMLEDCLDDEAIVKYDHLKDGLPGEKFDGDTQCLYLYGDGWTLHQDRKAKTHPEFDNTCRELWCKKPFKTKFGIRTKYQSPQSAALPG